MDRRDFLTITAVVPVALAACQGRDAEPAPPQPDLMQQLRAYVIGPGVAPATTFVPLPRRAP